LNSTSGSNIVIAFQGSRPPAAPITLLPLVSQANLAVSLYI
jgi:hypothetical protein